MNWFVPINEIVIGCSLESLLYCYFKEVPFLYSKLKSPHEFDFIDDLSLEQFKISFESKLLTSPTGTKQSRMPKKILWDRLLFILSLSRFNLMPGECMSIKIEDNEIKAVTPYARMGKFSFNKLTVFDDTNVVGLHRPNKNDIFGYKVYDWINIRKCTKHPYDYIQGTDDLVKEIIFYPSRRGAAIRKYIKDAIAISYIGEDFINDYEYSDVNVKFKVLYMMKEAGIKGRRCGRRMKNKEQFQYYALKIETTKRDIEPLYPYNIYSNKDNVEFNYQSYEEIFKQFEGYKSSLQECIGKLSARN